MKKVKVMVLAIVMCLCFNSCALLFNGTTQSISVKSMTPEAKIYVDGEYVGEDAVTLKLRRKDDHQLLVKKDGYETSTKLLDSKVQAGWVVFDALFNWFAFLTDAPTGAWKGFDKKTYVVKLEEKK